MTPAELAAYIAVLPPNCAEVELSVGGNVVKLRLAPPVGVIERARPSDLGAIPDAELQDAFPGVPPETIRHLMAKRDGI